MAKKKATTRVRDPFSFNFGANVKPRKSTGKKSGGKGGKKSSAWAAYMEGA